MATSGEDQFGRPTHVNLRPSKPVSVIDHGRTKLGTVGLDGSIRWVGHIAATPKLEQAIAAGHEAAPWAKYTAVEHQGEIIAVVMKPRTKPDALGVGTSPVRYSTLDARVVRLR